VEELPADLDRRAGGIRVDGAAGARVQDWAWREGRLVRELWRPRLDYHQNRLRVFVVDTAHAVRWIK